MTQPTTTTTKKTKSSRGRWASLLSSLLSFLFISCSHTPSGVLSQEKMASLLADMSIAEAVVDMNYTAFHNDSLRKSLKQSVLAAHHIDQAGLDSSFTWYGNHIEDYVKVCDRTVEILEQRQRTVASNASSRMAIAGDSVDVWSSVRHLRVSSEMPLKMLTFAVEPDSNWQAGDVYLLRYKAVGNQRPVEARLLADYTDGLTAYSTPTDRRSDSHYMLRLPLDSTHTVSRVYGYITLSPSTGGADNFHIDSISLVRMRRSIAGYDYTPLTNLIPGRRKTSFTPGPRAAENAEKSEKSDNSGNSDNSEALKQAASTEALTHPNPAQPYRPARSRNSRRR